MKVNREIRAKKNEDALMILRVKNREKNSEKVSRRVERDALANE